jgi:hypothetical protein
MIAPSGRTTTSGLMQCSKTASPINNHGGFQREASRPGSRPTRRRPLRSWIRRFGRSRASPRKPAGEFLEGGYSTLRSPRRRGISDPTIMRFLRNNSVFTYGQADSAIRLGDPLGVDRCSLSCPQSRISVEIGLSNLLSEAGTQLHRCAEVLLAK